MKKKTEQVWEEYCCKLHQFISNRIADKSLADDILQDVFIKIHSRIDTLKDENKLTSWIYQITRNAIIDYYRKPKLHYDDLDEIHDKDEENNSFIVPFESTFNEEDSMQIIASDLKDMINDLPAKYSEAIKLVEFEGLTQVQLAEKLKISISGAKSRVQRARQMLKDSLMKCCHYEFDKYGTIISHHPLTCCCCEDK